MPVSALRADQPPETLLELQNGLGQLVIAKGVAAGGADRVQAGLEQRAGRVR